MTVYILSIGDSRHGSHIFGVYATEDIARRHVRDAFKLMQSYYGGGAEFHVLPDSTMFRGTQGLARIDAFEVQGWE